MVVISKIYWFKKSTSGLVVKIQNYRRKLFFLSIKRVLIEIFSNSNGTFSGSMVVISKIYWLKKSTSGFVRKFQNSHQKPFFSQKPSDSNYPLFSGKPAISKIRFDFPLFPGDPLDPGDPLVPGDRKNIPLSGPFHTVDKRPASPPHLVKKRKARELCEILRTLYLNSQHFKKSQQTKTPVTVIFHSFLVLDLHWYFFANFKISLTDDNSYMIFPINTLASKCVF